MKKNQLYLSDNNLREVTVRKSDMVSGAMSASEKNIIPLQGMFRSGTNYTRSLLELNYECEVVYNNHGWKHSFFPIIENNSKVKYRNNSGLIVTKHPFHQLLSLKEYAYTNGRNIVCAENPDRFLMEPIIIFDNASKLKVQYWFENPVSYYNAMNWNLLSTCEPEGVGNIHLQYEALLLYPRECASHIAQFFGLSSRGEEGEFQLVEMTAKNMSDSRKRFSDAQSDTAYTLNRKFKPKSKEDILQYWGGSSIEFIERNLSQELCKNLQYS